MSTFLIELGVKILIGFVVLTMLTLLAEPVKAGFEGSKPWWPKLPLLVYVVLFPVFLAIIIVNIMLSAGKEVFHMLTNFKD